MFKLTVILILLCAGSLLAAGLSCSSCGPECAPACGTRHFRSCCFNYLRKKRGQDVLFPIENLLKPEIDQYSDGSDLWGLPTIDYELYRKDNRIENRLHNIYY